MKVHGALARAEALAAKDPNWMNVTERESEAEPTVIEQRDADFAALGEQAAHAVRSGAVKTMVDAKMLLGLYATMEAFREMVYSEPVGRRPKRRGE